MSRIFKLLLEVLRDLVTQMTYLKRLRLSLLWNVVILEVLRRLCPQRSQSLIEVGGNCTEEVEGAFT